MLFLIPLYAIVVFVALLVLVSGAIVAGVKIGLRLWDNFHKVRER